MSAIRLKLAAIVLISAFGASTAHAQKTFPSLFAGQNREVSTTLVRAEPVRPIAGRTANQIALSQQGRSNGAAIGQTGVRNAAAINQRGDSNTGQVSQTGTNNAAAIHQLGSNNNGSITQTGANNAACLVQLGRNNSAGITQTGNGNSIGIAQSSRRVWEFPPELCGQYGNDPWNLKRQVRGIGLEPLRP